jgi:hypothetical protein
MACKCGQNPCECIMVPVGQEITVVAEKLRDEVELYDAGQLRYVDGKIEVPVGYWAWRRLRELAGPRPW